MSEKFLNEMLDNGCELIEPDVAAFQAEAERILPDMFTTTWTVTTLDEVRAMAE